MPDEPWVIRVAPQPGVGIRGEVASGEQTMGRGEEEGEEEEGEESGDREEEDNSDGRDDGDDGDDGDEERQ